jgi:hypothetical protein
MVMYLRCAWIILLSSASVAGAQEVEGKVDVSTPFYRVTTTLPDVASTDGTKTDLNLELLVSPQGEVDTVAVTAASGSLCEKICWPEGNPPRTVCYVLMPCGGGGGGGATLQAPILVDFQLNKPATTASQNLPAFDVTIRPATSEGASTASQTFELQVDSKM